MLLVVISLTNSFAHSTHHEKHYQRIFCEKVHGKMEYRLKDGTRVDCQTPTYSFEVDFGHKAFESVGQALYYAMMTGKRPGIVLISETPKDDRYIGRIKALAKRYGIYLFVIDEMGRIRAIK
ncbi:hypothetical protein [Hydrogenimonas urashimensis]|uniref:hypothetical protein n=1 Tax=Hydrogenimonas urashimensis TaxID=2740515 RepID=UPI0019158F38|nr:hypothetical protein [Hydrogenimonas urashimensis]